MNSLRINGETIEGHVDDPNNRQVAFLAALAMPGSTAYAPVSSDGDIVAPVAPDVQQSSLLQGIIATSLDGTSRPE